MQHLFAKRQRRMLAAGFTPSRAIVEILESRILLSGQIFVTNRGTNTISEYDTSGTAISAPLATGLNDPIGIAVSGSDIFVGNQGAGTIGEYTTSGETVNASLITGLSNPVGIAVSGTNLFVVNGGSNSSNGSIGEYTISGTAVNPSLVSGLEYPSGIAVSGSDLFVTEIDNNISAEGYVVAEYTTSGLTVNGSLVSGLNNPDRIALSGSDLFVVNGGSDANNHNGTVGEYNINTGNAINAALVTGLNSPSGIAVSGADLFIGDLDDGTIGEYDATTGAVLSNPLISDLNAPDGVAVTAGSVATPVVTWANPANITYGTPLTDTQLDASANVAGTFAYTPAAGTVLTVGNNQTLSVTFTPTDTADYLTTTGNVQINVTAPPVPAELAFAQQPANPTTTSTLAPITVDVEDSTGTLVANDDSNVTLTMNGGPDGATLAGTTTVAAVKGVATFSDVIVNAPGNYALQATDGTLAPAVSNAFSVVPTAPSITSAETVTFTTGATGSFTVTSTGFPIAMFSKNGNLPDGVNLVDNHDGTATLSGTPSAPGSFNLTIVAANGTSPNAVQTFTLNVSTPVFVSVVANKASITQPAPGTPASKARFIISRTGPTISALTVQFTLTGSAVAGQDYDDPGTSVVIPTGEASAVVRIVVDNLVGKPNEGITLNISPANDYVQAQTPLQSSASINLIDTNRLVTLSSTSLPPGGTLKIIGNFDAAANTQVEFTEPGGLSVLVDPITVSAGKVNVPVPTYIDPATAQIAAGFDSVSVQQQTSVGLMTTVPATNFGVNDLPQTGLSVNGSLTNAYLGAIKKILKSAISNFNQIGLISGETADLSPLVGDLQTLHDQYATLQADIAPILADPSVTVDAGSYNGQDMVMNSAALGLTDQLIAGIMFGDKGAAPANIQGESTLKSASAELNAAAAPPAPTGTAASIASFLISGAGNLLSNTNTQKKWGQPYLNVVLLGSAILAAVTPPAAPVYAAADACLVGGWFLATTVAPALISIAMETAGTLILGGNPWSAIQPSVRFLVGGTLTQMQDDVLGISGELGGRFGPAMVSGASAAIDIVSEANRGNPTSAVSFLYSLIAAALSGTPFSFSTSSIAFTAVQNGPNPATQTITLTATTNPPIPFKCVPLGLSQWMNVSQTSGIGGVFVFTVSANVGTMPAGTYSQLINFTDSFIVNGFPAKESQNISVTLTITPKQTPPPQPTPSLIGTWEGMMTVPVFNFGSDTTDLTMNFTTSDGSIGGNYTAIVTGSGSYDPPGTELEDDTFYSVSLVGNNLTIQTTDGDNFMGTISGNTIMGTTDILEPGTFGGSFSITKQ